MKRVNPHYVPANKELPLSAVPFYCRRAFIHQKKALVASSKELLLKLLSLPTGPRRHGLGESGRDENGTICAGKPS